MARPSEAAIIRVQNQLRIAGRPCSFSDACAEMGRRGARKRKMRLTPAYYMNTEVGHSCLPPGDR
jgi:hypothetical protein